jgi:hypothetical protein
LKNPAKDAMRGGLRPFHHGSIGYKKSAAAAGGGSALD